MLIRRSCTEDLKYLIFLKDNSDGTTKESGCDYVRKQCHNIIKLDATCPTTSIESVFLIIVISEKDRLDVATLDIHVAFMQTNIQGYTVRVKFEGRMETIL